jgi:hypothetical protein
MVQRQEEQEKREFLRWAGEMYEELREWRKQHPAASFDEIAGQVTPRRRQLMGKLLGQLALQHGDGEVIEGLSCPECGQEMRYKGKPKRRVAHMEGEVKLERAYYYCAQCEAGLSPPG